MANSIYHLSHFSWRWRETKLTRFWRYSWSGSTPLLFFLFPSSPSWLPLCGYHSWFCTCKWYGREGRGSVWIQCPLLLLLTRLLLFPGRSRSGLASRSTLRNHGHGVSLGKQRPGQQGFTQALIILRAISGGSPELYTLLELLSLIVQSPRWLKKMKSFCLLWNLLYLFVFLPHFNRFF